MGFNKVISYYFIAKLFLITFNFRKSTGCVFVHHPVY